MNPWSVAGGGGLPNSRWAGLSRGSSHRLSGVQARLVAQVPCALWVKGQIWWRIAVGGRMRTLRKKGRQVLHCFTVVLDPGALLPAATGLPMARAGCRMALGCGVLCAAARPERGVKV